MACGNCAVWGFRLACLIDGFVCYSGCCAFAVSVGGFWCCLVFVLDLRGSLEYLSGICSLLGTLG